MVTLKWQRILGLCFVKLLYIQCQSVWLATLPECSSLCVTTKLCYILMEIQTMGYVAKLFYFRLILIGIVDTDAIVSHALSLVACLISFWIIIVLHFIILIQNCIISHCSVTGNITSRLLISPRSPGDSITHVRGLQYTKVRDQRTGAVSSESNDLNEFHCRWKVRSTQTLKC